MIWSMPRCMSAANRPPSKRTALANGEWPRGILPSASSRTTCEGMAHALSSICPWMNHGPAPRPVSYTHLRAHETSAHL
eukprot:6630575-Alexandrium_andersonii.AAC.1